MRLHQFLQRSTESHPDGVAVVDGDTSMSYAQLSELSDRVRDRLWQEGVRPGDRVGIMLRKSIDSVASIFGILKIGAAYVPVDAEAPIERGAFILSDCAVKAAIVERRRLESLEAEFARLGFDPRRLALDGTGGGAWLSEMLDSQDRESPAAEVETVNPGEDDLAYILYTSGSTGKPKGVMLSHRNAVSFVDWCSEVFEPRREDRFSSHAPFHFDLSILDLYVPIKHGAAVVLIGEEVGKEPTKLAPLISRERISVWYSTPSVLSILAQFGGLDRQDCSSLRMVLFAGEVFPLKHLRHLKSLWPSPQYFNLYGPTETNVCTFYELPGEIPADRADPFPIGPACSHSNCRVLSSSGEEIAQGEEGELCVNGPGVMLGYWNRPEQTRDAFHVASDGSRWYRTGDIVVEDLDTGYRYVGRRDRMIKKRGFRVELGEIESALYRHPQVREAAVIGVQDEEHGVTVKAFLVCQEGRLSIIELKRFCGDHLPPYMIPDLFVFPSALPKTSTDKIDYQGLKECV